MTLKHKTSKRKRAVQVAGAVLLADAGSGVRDLWVLVALTDTGTHVTSVDAAWTELKSVRDTANDLVVAAGLLFDHHRHLTGFRDGHRAVASPTHNPVPAFVGDASLCAALQHRLDPVVGADETGWVFCCDDGLGAVIPKGTPAMLFVDWDTHVAWPSLSVRRATVGEYLGVTVPHLHVRRAHGHDALPAWYLAGDQAPDVGIVVQRPGHDAEYVEFQCTVRGGDSVKALTTLCFE